MIEPIGWRIVIKPDAVINEKEIKTDSGLVVKLAVSVDEKIERNATTAGTIVAIGPDAFDAYKLSSKHGGLKIGDHVCYAKYAGKWVVDTETKEELLVVNDEDVVCKA